MKKLIVILLVCNGISAVTYRIINNSDTCFLLRTSETLESEFSHIVVPLRRKTFNICLNKSNSLLIFKNFFDEDEEEIIYFPANNKKMLSLTIDEDHCITAEEMPITEVD